METNDSIGPLIQAFAEGELDEETRALVQQHLANNPESCQEHFEIKKATRMLQRAMSGEKLGEDFSHRVGDRLFSKEGHAWSTAREFALRRRIAKTRRARRRVVFALAATACMAVMTIGVVYVYLESVPANKVLASLAPSIPAIGSVEIVHGRTKIAMASSGESIPFGYGVYTDSVLSTKENSQMAILLEDRSTVKMNGDTTLKVNSPRWLSLQEGEILVNVEKNEGKAFQIDTPNAKVIVTGTKFSLRVAAEATEVRLMEGKLSVTGKEGHLPLNAGESAEVRGDGTPQFVDFEVPQSSLKWAESLEMGTQKRTQMLAHDDGAPSGDRFLAEGREAWLSFDSAEPGVLRSLWIYGGVYSFTPGISDFGKTFDIQVYNSARKPVGSRYVKSYNRFGSVPGWTTIDLEPPVRIEGKFHVSIRPNGGENAALILSTDEDAAGKHSQIAVMEDETPEFTRADNWMVRAIVAPEDEIKN